MDFSTGNSGNKLFHTVTKIGPGCQQEGAYCEHLGPIVVPHVFAIIPGGYVMEALEPAPRTPDLLCQIERLLEMRVWNQPALPVSTEIDWRDRLWEYEIITPDFAVPESYCLVHGDPTASNALIRGGNIVLCDPRPPRDYVPQARETDMGRILQSMFHWEVAAYDAPLVEFIRPAFTYHKETFNRAMFWCKAAAERIRRLELSRKEHTRVKVIVWCDMIKNLTYYV